MLTRLVALLVGVAVGAAAASRVRLENDVSPDRHGDWLQVGRADPDQFLELHVALAQKESGRAALERSFEDISNPRSPHYGKHLSNEIVHKMLQPPTSSIDAVRDAFAAAGIFLEAATPNGDILHGVASIRSTEAVLGCEYFLYRHRATGVEAYRTPSYSLPVDLARVVDLVAPTVRLPAEAVPHARKSAVEAQFGGLNTPKSLRELYGVGDTVGIAASNKQAVTGFLGQHYSATDLREFHLLYFHKAGVGAKLEQVGDDRGLLSGIEAMLDAEYVTALGANITTEFWGFKGQAPDNPQNEPFLKWLSLLSNTSDTEAPKLFSTSYGEDESSVSIAYATRINTEFIKAGRLPDDPPAG